MSLESVHLRTASLSIAIDRYILFLQMDNQKPRTVQGSLAMLTRLRHWCQERSVTTAAEITPDVLQGYRRYLFQFINPRNGKSLMPATQAVHLIIVRSFCKWLRKHRVIDFDPSEALPLPKMTRHTLGEVLTLDEVNRLLVTPNLNTRTGVRNRAILETFYSTAIRASELSNLNLSDIDADRGLVHVRQGKGDRDRITPIGDEAIQWITKYVEDVRPQWVRASSGNALFIGLFGNRVSRTCLALVVRQAITKADIAKVGACHLLRHTAATLMMDNGADLRSLQTYLGHARLDTTQIYTHMTLGRLKDVHSKTHPTGNDRMQRNNQPTDPPADH